MEHEGAVNMTVSQDLLIQKLILRLITLKLPRHLPVNKVDVEHNCFPNCQDILLVPLIEYQPLTWSPGLIPEYAMKMTSLIGQLILKLFS